MRVGFGNNHMAIGLRNVLMEYLQEKGYECIDSGPSDPTGEVSYPRPGRLVARALMRGEVHRDVLICGTGISISLTVNEVSGVRTAACSESYSVKPTVEYSNANIIATNTRVVGTELVKMIADELFAAWFEGGRHATRVDMVSEIEAKHGAKWYE